MYRRFKLMLSIFSFAISLGLMTFAVFAATSHTLGINNTISFDIEDNISFNMTANAYHGNLKDENLSIVTNYTDRTDKPTAFNNNEKLVVTIDEKVNSVLNQGWAPFTETSGIITASENSLVWEYVFECTSENNLKVEVLLDEYFWGEQVTSATNYSIDTTYQLGTSEEDFDNVSSSVLKTTTLKKFLKVKIVFTVKNLSNNINGEQLNYTVRISEENVVFSDVSMMTFSTSAEACTLTSLDLEENVNTVVIPETYNGLPVTKIQSTASTGILANNDKVSEVVLPESVIEISNNNQTTANSGVFENCSNLEVINLENVDTLSPNLFYGCTNLKSIELADNVTIIPENCFYGCTDLERINLDNITTINTKSFRDCQSLTSVDLSSIQTIGTQSFRNCIKLADVVLPNSAYNINQGAFYECDALTSIDLSYGTITSSYAFFQCDNLKNVILNNSQSTIYEYTFYKCVKLESVNLQNITSYERGCFAYCENLSCFDGTNKNGSLVFNNNLSNLAKESFMNCTKLTSVTLPHRVSYLTLGESCFKNAGLSGEFLLPNYYSLGDIALAGQFTGCPITNFVVEDNNAYYNTDGIAIYTLSTSTLYKAIYLIAYPSGNTNQSYEVKATAKSIRAEEFENAKNLTNLTVNANSTYLQSSNNIIYVKNSSAVVAKLS